MMQGLTRAGGGSAAERFRPPVNVLTHVSPVTLPLKNNWKFAEPGHKRSCNNDDKLWRSGTAEMH